MLGVQVEEELGAAMELHEQMLKRKAQLEAQLETQRAALEMVQEMAPKVC